MPHQLYAHYLPPTFTQKGVLPAACFKWSLALISYAYKCASALPSQPNLRNHSTWLAFSLPKIDITARRFLDAAPVSEYRPALAISHDVNFVGINGVLWTSRRLMPSARLSDNASLLELEPTLSECPLLGRAELFNIKSWWSS